MDNKQNMHRCCFTGHRPEKLYITETEIKSRLERAIQQAVSDGFTTFISGMSRGVDMWAAETVIKMRENNPQIKLICASPYRGFEQRWNYNEKQRYNYILFRADCIRFVCDGYSRFCFQARNKFMVDNSARVISAYNGGSGGTRNTVLYAESRGVEIVNILDNTAGLQSKAML